jgi:hypothetical protein
MHNLQFVDLNIIHGKYDLLCQQTQTLNLLVVVQGQCTMGCAADESGMEGGFSVP